MQDRSTRDAFLHFLNCHIDLCQTLSKSLAKRVHDRYVALPTFCTPVEGPRLKDVDSSIVRMNAMLPTCNLVPNRLRPHEAAQAYRHLRIRVLK